ncbi:putative P-loop containing nucleoside triphosphate hydrolase, leucine-rich repeat domain, L [Medicago truncatula]|nr:putative P-loop containing nucleoside triphosphate hydrolase, leucine-rich repeat domain, L [Medicago truncatula]
MAFVGEAFLSASLEVLLDRIIPDELLYFSRNKELDTSLLKKLKITLLSLQAVMNDAEEKQITNPAVKQWLDELRDALYDADDLLDEINTESLRCKLEAESQIQQPFSDQVLNFLSSPFKSFFRVVNSEIQDVFQRLEQFSLQKDILELKQDDDRKKLKEFLLSKDGGRNIGVISIVGMGGIGKTTLAKLLYNDLEVGKNFDLKAWAYISKDFDVCRVTKILLECVSSKPVVTDNLNTLQVELQQSLRKKRYLLVLDDVWDGSYDEWNKLKAVFEAGEVGSKIVITTRDESVALAMQTHIPVHYLRSLRSEDCWSLLAHHAFGPNNCKEQSKLEVIGKEIAKRCGGLPLAAEAVGGLLRTKLSEKNWNKVLKSNIWDLPNIKVLPALLLSYHYLPAPLKRCFAYCSIFPKNSGLDKKMVVLLWMAEDLVHQYKGEKTVEEVVEEYFDELVSRSLIRRQMVNAKESFMMHDLINELATTVSSAFCIRLEDPKPCESLKRARHLSYIRGNYDCFNKFNMFHESKCLRTLLALPLRHWWSSKYPNLRSHYLSSKLLFDLLPAMKRLRVLSLSHYNNITELPNSFVNLIHLRYLDLSNTKIEKLPDVICKLYNLQTLLLSKCSSLTELPEDIGNLVNLRHLDLSDTKLKVMPIQIAKLQNLQTLSSFVVSRQSNGLKIGELRKFPHLQGKLSISKLQNVTDLSDAVHANLEKKEEIDELTLEWDRDTTEDSQMERLVLEQLQPSTNLKKLTIQFFGGTSFPNWLGDSSFRNMMYLRISGCDHCWSLPPLGELLSLKELFISGLISVKMVGTEFYGSISSLSFQPFPSLEILCFEDMPEWKEWNMIGGTTIEFPSLRRLFLCDCPKLKGNIPQNLPSLVELELSKCPLLRSQEVDSSISSSIRRPSHPEWMMIELNSLKQLTISSIVSLSSFPLELLPRTLKSLTFLSCENLEFLPHESSPIDTSLEKLQIFNSCNSMTSFYLGCFPVLKSLFILGCKNLKSISVAEDDASHSHSFLQSLSIYACPNLESFPFHGLTTPNLNSFMVSSCPKLKSLPEPIHSLSSLYQLIVYGLPKLQTFAQESLPSNLRILEVSNYGSLSTSAITKWGLKYLTCLAELRIRGDGLVNSLMKMEESLLPNSLVSIHISHLYYQKCLTGKWLQHLTSLENLEISDCRRLESLPEEGLPSSLSVLTIKRCLLLQANCQSNGGKEWHKISHIPCIIIDNKVII